MRRIKIYAAVLAAAAVLASGCGSSGQAVAESPEESGIESSVQPESGGSVESEEPLASDSGDTQEQVIIEESQVPLYTRPQGSNVRVPQASGTVVYSNSTVTVDASNTSNGYVMVQYTGGASKIKVQVMKSGGETYTYDLNARSAYEVFPLTEGNGTYTVRVLEQVQGNQYGVKLSQDMNVSLSNEFEPFLYPNQYVNFTVNSKAVQKGAELASAAADDLGIVTNVYNYVVDNFTYDTAKAASVQSGYLPNVDEIMDKQTGICFDYAAVMTAMLRSQNIPTKLVVGYTGSLYHAWVDVYLEGQGWVDNIIYFDGNRWRMMDPTFASSGKNDPSIQQYITNTANYQAKYAY
ncbi:MAG TPA: transglutaminase-like domain-containing protein [Candidatus Hungatella pullicola]|nr:transglutaminase-like domain-containing protein [Candidatus Hungatella pullicola]